ncbi:Pirin [Caenispirillum salinarum AK4]|uniref:Pirin n=1 Tax=Caenispirillum salinarum AK4 TaxID=1238182 RepID=K9HTY8_9PROT|nr:pirin family protein [Caenispirillum salinarum]EKV31691.1 Pirin [Caenispirillum salinarum AK4]
MSTSTMPSGRSVARVVDGMPAQDGAGVKLTRMIGQPKLDVIDPILMLDRIRSDDPKAYIAGFPPHPHRGFETVTYMVQGRMRHRDNHGGEGLIVDGGVQWMTAGRGIEHSEMPEQTDGLLFGFQLWLNLPADEKMREPWYADIPADRLAAVEPAPGVSVKLIAGTWGEAAGPAPERATRPFIADVTLEENAPVDLPLPDGHAGFVLPFSGTVALGPGESAEMVPEGRVAVVEEGEGSLRAVGGPDGARLLVVAAKPLKEPIAKYGPFVMTTREQLMQAVEDYRAGRF